MTDPSLPASTFQERDAASYDDVVETFDRFTRRFTEALGRKAVDLGGVGHGDRVLDVGTGTGVVALEAARRVGESGHVTGLDLSAGMLDEARRSAGDAGLADRVAFVAGDAERLPFPDATFDRVLSLFALLHFPHPDRALAEMHRVLRPAGRVVIGIGAHPPWLSIGGLAYAARRLPLALQRRRGRWLVAPQFLVGLVEERLGPSGEAEETHLAAHRHRSARALPGMLRAAGFEGVRGTSRSGVGRIATVQEFWDLQRTFSSIARKRLSAARAEERERLRRVFWERCEAVLRSGGRLTYPYTAYYAAGTRR